MEKQIRLLGILYIIYNMISLMLALVVKLTFLGVGVFLEAVAEGFPPLPLGDLSRAGWLLGGALLLSSLPGVIAGMGLLKFKPWSRILALIVAVFMLFGFPFGTALAVYAFFILLSRESDKYFHSIN